MTDLDHIYFRLKRRGLSETDATMQVLAWASLGPKPEQPEYIPGLRAENQRRYLEWHEKIVGWRLGKNRTTNQWFAVERRINV